MSSRDMSQAELARRLSRNPATVSHWLTGRRTPQLATMERVAEVLCVRVAWLSVGDGTMTEARRQRRHRDGDPDPEDTGRAPREAAA